MLSHREKIISKNRTNRLQQMLKSKRDAFNQLARQQIDEDFRMFYPQINHANFSQFKIKIREWINFEQYRTQLGVFINIVYEFVLDHPQDKDALYIFKELTAVEDIELPQTQELVEFLICLASFSLYDSLTILSHILAFQKYKQVLIKKVLSSQYIQKIVQSCFQEDQIIMCCSIISYLLTKADIYQFTLYSQKMVKNINLEEVKWIVLDFFSQINSTMPPQHKKASILFQYFHFLLVPSQQTLLSSLNFLKFLIKSQIQTPQPDNLIHFGLNSNKFSNIELCLQCLSLLFEKEQFQLEGQIIVKLWDLIQNSDCATTQKQCLSLMNKLNPEQIRLLIENVELRYLINFLTQLLKEESVQLQIIDLLVLIGEETDEVQDILIENDGKNLLNQIALQSKGEKFSKIDEFLNTFTQ